MKITRRCGAKHISKLKCIKHMLGLFLEIEISKKNTPLWYEAHLQVKKLKTPYVRTAFAMSKKRMPLWYEAHFEVKIHKTHQVRTTSGS